MDRTAEVPIPLSAAGRWLRTGWAGLNELWRTQKARRALLVKETAALGERRFVAVVQFESKRFLVGASSGSITLLAELPDADLTGEQPR